MGQPGVGFEALGSGRILCGINDSPAEEKSWYILTILARMGRPCTPEEISEKCTLFCVTPDEVCYLCRIPGFPLSIREGCISCSTLSLSVFENFFSKSVPDLRKEVQGELPLRSPRKRPCEELKETDAYRRPNKLPKLEATISVGSGVGDGSPPEGELQKDSAYKKTQNVTGGSGCKMTENDIALDGCQEKNSLPAEAIVTVDVAEKGEVDINMAATTVRAENNPSLTKPVHSSGSADGNCDVKNDCFITYKKRKGQISKTQLACVDNKALVGDAVASMNASISPTEIYLIPKEEVYRKEKMTNSIGHISPGDLVNGNDIHGGKVECEPNDTPMFKHTMKPEMQTLKPEDGLKDDCATLVGDAVVPLQAGIPTTEVSLPKEYPIEDKMAKCSVDHISLEEAVRENTTKLGNTKSELKEDQALKSKLKPELASNKGDNFQTNNLPKREADCVNNEKMSHAKQKIRKTGRAHPVMKDEKDTAAPASVTNTVGSKLIPLFESFIVEDEEGSGGYGTVYKARRKQDGKIFAIKCPLEKTSSNYVTNEMKMLEKFCGKNFIIKYEGSFNYNDCDCLILQHVEHEKPEVLKREIDISQLRWYGYCMFKALQTLHKQGIIHRDVKPGNFLFSRKSSKGYLIDFNLAIDLFDLNSGRSKPKMHLNNQKSSLASATHKPPFFSRRDTLDFRQKTLIAAADETTVVKQTTQAHMKPSGNAIKRGGQTFEVRHHDSTNYKAQSNLPLDKMDTNQRIKLGERMAGKVSGLHLLVSPSNEITSARSPSGGNRREPLPNQGRKELLNLLHEAQHSPQQQAPLIPVSQRKRVAAPQERARRDNGNIINASPMPFQSLVDRNLYGLNGIPKNKDGQKFKREGPCVGTKGYRAPEVLLRSPHQGCKLDIWSAGVSLLYLMAGKIPFQAGNPDQAIKDIAKIRGIEEIWELAKLHDRESSLPGDVCSHEFVNISIKEWCRKNTKRPELLDCIPPSLYDLVEKCLCVNPRQRIDADQALEHDFFAPCYEALKKARSSSRESVVTDLTSTQTFNSAC